MKGGDIMNLWKRKPKPPDRIKDSVEVVDNIRLDETRTMLDELSAQSIAEVTKWDYGDMLLKVLVVLHPEVKAHPLFIEYSDRVTRYFENQKKEAEMPKQDTLKSPNCPQCGKWLDRVRVRVLKQLSASGRAQPGDEGVGWICADCKGK